MSHGHAKNGHRARPLHPKKTYPILAQSSARPSSILKESIMLPSPLKAIYDECNKGNSWEKYNNLPAFPRILDLELTNTCNFRCLMCPTGTFQQKREKGFMPDEVFYKVLDEAAVHGTALRFIRWGEPFMHENLFDYLRAAKEQGVICHVNTNGSYLTDEAIDSIFDVGLDAIKFSFQGVDVQSYKEMRNIDFFDELIENVGRLYRARGDRHFPHIQVSTTITYESREQVQDFRKRVREVADLVTIGRTVLEHLDLNAVRIRPHEFEQLKKLKEMESLIKVHPECPEVFDKMSVNWNGTVSACCMDSDSIMIIGDLSKQSLQEVWDSQILDRYRTMLADMRHDELPLCKGCYDSSNMVVQGLIDHAAEETEEGESTGEADPLLYETR
jgi:MoaA/NifB/PqqE/SkfB family radical SAM enzyme